MQQGAGKTGKAVQSKVKTSRAAPHNQDWQGVQKQGGVVEAGIGGMPVGWQDVVNPCSASRGCQGRKCGAARCSLGRAVEAGRVFQY